MNVFEGIRESLTEILDVEPDCITPETYLVRDLSAESIDLLELSVALNARFKIEMNEDQVFLKTLRLCLNQAPQDGDSAAGRIAGEFPHLGGERVGEILGDLDGGPVLRVKDIASYVSWRIGSN